MQLPQQLAQCRLLRHGRMPRWRCAAAPQQAQVQSGSKNSKGRLLYDAVALDMDGTLTKAHIGG